MARGWALRMLACLAAVTVLLTGCSQPSKPIASAPKPTTTSASASPTLPPLGPPDMPMPAAARQMTPDGFNAFTQYYIDLINHLNKKLDGTELRALSRGCDTCNRIANDADSDAQKGYSYQGGHITISSIAPPHFTEEGAENAFTVDQDAYMVVDSAGNPVAGLTSPALTNVAAGMAGSWIGDHWIVTGLSFG